MRPSLTVARVALTAALALGSLPGLVGAREPSPDQPIDAAAFQPVILATLGDRPTRASAISAAAGGSAATLDSATAFVELGPGARLLVARPSVAVPAVSPASAWKPPLFTLSGIASFYDNGTTAMTAVPRGTIIVICGAGGCLQRVVNDYGPAKWTGRLIDMYRPDFFAICGCGSYAGLTNVTVRVYGQG
ncbi:MAG TPA: hypothetical protein VFW20_05065 [Candidatus Limnocylindrales bacterium]|nr:hypothetical protein [Candidatus Limnocylindrales bacterium]